ncbi:unnamed protein product, partial [Urochloa humidicola]
SPSAVVTGPPNPSRSKRLPPRAVFLPQIRPIGAMALRFLARRIGTPALRWAPAPRLSPPAPPSGPLASHSSQVGFSNGVGKARKMVNTELAGKEKVPRREIFEALGELEESTIAMREAMQRERKRRDRIYLTSAVLIMGGTLSCIVQGDMARQVEIKKLLSDE